MSRRISGQSSADSLAFSSSTTYLGTNAVDDENNYTSAITKDSPSHTICYSIGCDKPATKIVKVPLNAKLCCIVHVCDNCLQKYQANDDTCSDNDNCHHR
jgi:hypothetical protein